MLWVGWNDIDVGSWRGWKTEAKDDDGALSACGAFGGKEPKDVIGEKVDFAAFESAGVVEKVLASKVPAPEASFPEPKVAWTLAGGWAEGVDGTVWAFFAGKQYLNYCIKPDLRLLLTIHFAKLYFSIPAI